MYVWLRLAASPPRDWYAKLALARGHEMRRVVTGLRNVHSARSPDDVRMSQLGSRIPLVSLLHALAVAEHLNFRHAASAMGVSQSSVSTRIKQLEQDLGVLLFERRLKWRPFDGGRPAFP